MRIASSSRPNEFGSTTPLAGKSPEWSYASLTLQYYKVVYLIKRGPENDKIAGQHMTVFDYKRLSLVCSTADPIKPVSERRGMTYAKFSNYHAGASSLRDLKAPSAGRWSRASFVEFEWWKGTR
jgi:hypothetical protein